MAFATPSQGTFRVEWRLRRRRKELSAWNGVCDAVARNFPRGMAFATPSRGAFRVEWRLRRRREELSAWNGVCDAVANSIKTLILL